MAIIAGIFIVIREDIFTPSNILIDISGILVIILVIQGSGIIASAQVKISSELAKKDKADFNKIDKLNKTIAYISISQIPFTLAIIYVMAMITIS